MGVSESSVKNLVQHLFSKAGVRTRSQLVRAAHEGLLGPAHEMTKPESNEISTLTRQASLEHQAGPDCPETVRILS
jgi:hypothetical protein